MQLKPKDLSPVYSFSDNSERVLLREREEPADIGVFATKTSCWNIKRLLLIKENWTSQVKEFSAFLCMGKIQEFGLPEVIPLTCTSAIWGQCPGFSLPECPQDVS